MNIRVHAESGDPAGHDLLAYMLLARHAHDRVVGTAAPGPGRAVLRRLQGMRVAGTSRTCTCGKRLDGCLPRFG
jgi:hypothetical protein